MFPIQDGVAKRYPPLMTWLLIGLNVGMFLIEAGLPPPEREQFLLTWGLVPARYFDPAYAASSGLLDYAPFLTNAFLHGGLFHILVNMWTLWIFGPAVEDRLGHARYLAFYLLTAIAASLAHALANPHSLVPAIGASGAIAGVIGCYVRLFPLARLVMVVPILFFPFFFEIPAAFFALLWFVSQLIPGLLTLGREVGGIAWWAHIGGFVAGYLLTPLLHRPRSGFRPFYGDEGWYGFSPDGRRLGRW